MLVKPDNVIYLNKILIRPKRKRKAGNSRLGGDMRTNRFAIIAGFVLAASIFLMAAFSYSENTVPSLKKAVLLSKAVRLGDILEIECELEKSAEGKYPPSPDSYIIGALCFASGFYISPIQGKMRGIVYDKLSPDKKIEDATEPFYMPLPLTPFALQWSLPHVLGACLL
jgi:hypothetical protein